MKILLVNPNTTSSMTDKAGEAARMVVASGTEIIAVNPEYGPISIEGYYDEVFSIPGLLEEVRKGEASGCHGTVIACFDDTGLDAARCIASGPVVGICEAATVFAVSPALSVIEEVVLGLTSKIFTAHTPFPASEPKRSLRF